VLSLKKREQVAGVMAQRAVFHIDETFNRVAVTGAHGVGEIVTEDGE